MKSSFILLAFILASNMIYSQWEWQNPRPTGNPFNDMYFTDEYHGWIVGTNGTVLKTINGGNDWEVIPTGTDKNLQEVVFWNDNAGLIVCADGNLLKTFNGGEYWHTITSGCNHVYDLEYNSGHAWLLADSRKVLHSSNFGYSWQLVYDNSNPDIVLTAISFADAYHGWATGRDQSGDTVVGILIETVDGGGTWQVDTLELEAWDHGLDIAFLNEFTGYLTTSFGYLFKTEDGGDSWDSIHPGGDVSTEMFFLDEDHGWLHCQDEGMGWGLKEFITQDGGMTWSELLFTNVFSSAVGTWFYSSPEIGYYIERNNSYNTDKLLKTFDGGNSWSDMNLLESISGVWYEYFIDLEMIDDQLGMALAHYLPGGMFSYTTTDGGQTWGNKNHLSGGNPEKICITGPTSGYIIGWENHYTGGWPPQSKDSSHVFRTIDGGSSWQNVSPDIDRQLYSGFFFSESEGFVIGNVGLIMYTDDAGLSWQQVMSSSNVKLRDITFSDRDHGWICGNSGTILRTVDGGMTWELQSSNCSADLETIDFFDAQYGCAAGSYGTIIYTHNGGETWHSGHSDSTLSFRDIEMENEKQIIAAARKGSSGYTGLIITSGDGGETWLRPDQPCHNQLYCVCIPEPGHIWVAGARSSILHFTGAIPVTADPLEHQISDNSIKVFPNPTGGPVNVQFANYCSQKVSMKIYDSQGREVATLLDRYLGEGKHSLLFEASDLPAGLYFIRMQTGLKTAAEKVIVY